MFYCFLSLVAETTPPGSPEEEFLEGVPGRDLLLKNVPEKKLSFCRAPKFP